MNVQSSTCPSNSELDAIAAGVQASFDPRLGATVKALGCAAGRAAPGGRRRLLATGSFVTLLMETTFSGASAPAEAHAWIRSVEAAAAAAEPSAVCGPVPALCALLAARALELLRLCTGNYVVSSDGAGCTCAPGYRPEPSLGVCEPTGARLRPAATC